VAPGFPADGSADGVADGVADGSWVGSRNFPVTWWRGVSAIFDLAHQEPQVSQVSHVTMLILMSGTSGSFGGGYDDPGVPLNSKRGDHMGNLSRMSPV